MSGTLIFKPLQASLKHDYDFIGKMDSYCKVKVGHRRARSSVCKHGGKHPSWNESLTIRRDFEPFCEIVLKTKNMIMPDSRIGACKIDLEAIAAQGRATRWYDVIKKDRIEGQLLVEVTFIPSGHQNIQPN